MKKRVLAALLVTMMTVGTVAGCGSNAKSDDSDKKASSESKSDDKKDSGKKVTVVTSGTGEPYSLISDDGKWTGIDAEMWDEIEKLHPETKVWETCTPYFERRNIHFYVNRCGFHIVEFLNEKNPGADMPEDFIGDRGQGMFVFRKQM